MIIEFTGPPATGKTSIGKLICSSSSMKLLRLSSKENHYDKLITLLLFLVWVIRYFPMVVTSFLSIRSQKRKRLSLKRALYISLQSGILKGAKHSKGVYIKDQGLFQMGSWIPDMIRKDSDKIAKLLSSISEIPDVVVIFSMPESLSERKLIERGDYKVWNIRAIESGFTSTRQKLTYERNLEWVKFELCKKLCIPCLVVCIDDDGGIKSIHIENYLEKDVNPRLAEILYDLKEKIQMSWVARNY